MALRRWSCARRKRQQNPPGLTGFAHQAAGNRPVGLTATGWVGANVSWRAWARTWMRKSTGNYLMDKNDLQFRRCPELLIMQSAEDCGRITHTSSACPLPQASSDAAVGKNCWALQTLGLIQFSPSCIPVWLCAWALRTSFALVGEFHPVSPARLQGAMMPFEEKVLLAGNRFESKSASPCWFLSAMRRMSELLLELLKSLFTELRL